MIDRYLSLIATICIGLFFAVHTALNDTPYDTLTINEFCKVLKPSNIEYKYPLDNHNRFGMNFNHTTSQANYAYSLVSPYKYRSNKYFSRDPNPIETLEEDDFFRIGMEKGQLVPMGFGTTIMSNAVPLVPAFNRGSWAQLEDFLRENYPNQLVYKGCEYPITPVENYRFKKMYYPMGCYYVVFDSTFLPTILENFSGLILDSGYYLNEADSHKERKLPYWIDCK
jgi:DNA/RNA endonuclease G (NUC1)